MSELAHLTEMLASDGRHEGGEPACGTIALRAVMAVLAWPGEALQVAMVLGGIRLTAAGPIKCAAAFRACSIGHVAAHRILPP